MRDILEALGKRGAGLKRLLHQGVDVDLAAGVVEVELKLRIKRARGGFEDGLGRGVVRAPEGDLAEHLLELDPHVRVGK